MNKLQNYIKKNKVTIKVIILLFIAKFLGFIKNIFLAKFYGTTIISDSYQMALSIAMIIIGIVLYSYQAFTKGFFISSKENRESQYTSSFINFISIILLLLVCIVILNPNLIIHLFAPGFNELQVSYTRELMLPIIIGTCFLVISNILSEYLRCKESYIIPQLCYLVINIIEILTIYLAFYANYKWLAYGYFIANLTYLIILLIIAFKNNLKYYFNIYKKDVSNFYIILMPVFVSSIITDLNSMIDKIFASKSEIGIISTLSYSTNIKTVTLIIAAGILTVLFPKISKKYVEKDYQGFNKTIFKTLKIIVCIYIPLTIFVIVFANIIVKIVYFRGAFDIDSLNSTTKCLQMYIIGITGISIRDLFIKALYCMEKGKIIILISAISVFLNVVLNYILYSKLGYIGLPLATSISVWIIIPILIIYYLKIIKVTIKKNSK